MRSKILVSVLVLVAAGCAADSPTVEAPTPEDDATVYQRRFDALFSNAAQSGEGLKGYDTMTPVPGAPDPQPLPAAAPHERTIDAAALRAARDYAAAANSLAFIVWRKGKIELAEYFGGADWSTPIVSRSLAKPITVQAVGRALKLGKIDSLDQPVADFIDEWRDSDKRKIRVRHLLDMRSGLLPQGFSLEPDNILNRAYLHPRHEDIIVNEYPLTHEPGSRYEYSNATSDLVAVLIQRATGEKYEEWVSEQVLKPLGAQGGEVWVNRPGGVAHAGCCMLLPAESYLRMAILLLQDGVWDGKRLLPEGYVDEVTTPTPMNPHTGMGVYVAGRYIERRGAANPEVELGRTLHGEPYLAADLFLFDGNSNQVVYIVPSEDLIVLRVGNRPPKEPEWDNAYLPNTLIAGIQRQPGEALPEPQPRD